MQTTYTLKTFRWPTFNMMNAALAVIKWKKFMGFYADLRNECVISYQTTGNSLSNEGL